MSGQFDADPGGEAILYSYGTAAPDGLLQIDASGSGVTTTETPLQIGGAFQPIVGDFDGNGVDDVLWYTPPAPPTTTCGPSTPPGRAPPAHADRRCVPTVDA